MYVTHSSGGEKFKSYYFPSLVIPGARAFSCEDCFVLAMAQGHHKEIISCGA